MRIDHLFVSNAFSIEQVQVVAGGSALVASDHLPLMAELKWTSRSQTQAKGRND